MKSTSTRRTFLAAATCSIAMLLEASIGAGAASAGSSGAKIHLTLWDQWGSSGPNWTALRHVIDEYEHLHPNVTITATFIENNAKILAAISARTPPDILDLGLSTEIGSWGSIGALMPLNSFISASHLDMSRYVPGAVKAVSVGSTIYGLPFMDFNAALLYNKTLFAKAGLNPNDPPKTTEQLYNDALRLTKVNSSGTITQLGFLPQWPGAANDQTCTLESLAWAFGGGWVSSSGSPTADSAANIAALTWEDSFYKKFGAQAMAAFQGSAGEYMTATDPFYSGKLAMTYDGPWNLAYMEKVAHKTATNIGIAPFPAPASSPGRTGTSFLDTNPQVIPRGSSNPQAAFDFIKWETTNSQLSTYFANVVYNIPQLVGAKPPSYPYASLFMKDAASANAHIWPQTPYSSTYQTDLCNAEGDTVNGKTSPAAALKSLQKLAEQAKSQAR